MNLISSQKSDATLQKYMQLIKPKVNRAHFKKFDRKKERLDVLYFKHLDVNTKFPNLASVLKIVFVLTHGQASVERGFSINESILEDNITEAYIVSHRLVKDYLTSNHLEPKDVKIHKICCFL